ncbi:hypothetical protein V8G54_000641, partial [Vigna mungo]
MVHNNLQKPRPCGFNRRNILNRQDIVRSCSRRLVGIETGAVLVYLHVHAIDGGGGIVIGVVAGGDVIDGGGRGSGVDGVEDVERALDEGRGRVEIVVLNGNPSTHLRKMKLNKRLLMEFAIQPKSMGCAWWWFLNVSLRVTPYLRFPVLEAVPKPDFHFG